MNRLQYAFYNISHKKKENKFEQIFKEIKTQIDIYERQYDLTLKSYVKEWDEEIIKLDQNYSKQKIEADKIYEQNFDIDDEYSHSYAMHISGLESLEYINIENKEEIDTEYKNFLDLYSKSILISLYSLNESKLSEITNIASELFNKKIKPSHFNSRDLSKIFYSIFKSCYRIGN